MIDDALTSLTFAGISYAFYVAYRNPTRNRVTQKLYRYFQVYNWSVVKPELPLLVGSCVAAGLAIMFLLFAFL